LEITPLQGGDLLYITTLFNIFCPLILSIRHISALFGAILCYVSLVLIVVLVIPNKSALRRIGDSLFPRGAVKSLLLTGFMLLALLNLLSLVCYSFPITTTLRFNLRMALWFWVSSVVLLLVKMRFCSTVLPVGSPWYLIPFLRLVELVSIGVRPVTLCFRLLANIRAGHILLSLITKIRIGMWLLGALFGLLELIVSLVQGFVFLILSNVYVEEALTH